MIVGALFGIGALLLVAFIVIERRVPEPVMPLDLFRIPALRAAAVLTVLARHDDVRGAVVPAAVRAGGHRDRRHQRAGRVLTPMMLGFMVSSAIGGRLLLRIGFRAQITLGCIIAVPGVFLLTLLDADSTTFEIGRDLVFVGLGLGLIVLACTLAAQNSVERKQMGTATGLVNFTRQLGGALGVALAGSVMLTSLTNRLADAFPGSTIPAGEMLSPSSSSQPLPAGAERIVQEAFAGALHQVFITALIIGVVLSACVVLMPRGHATVLRDRSQGHAPPPDAVAPDAEVYIAGETPLELDDSWSPSQAPAPAAPVGKAAGAADESEASSPVR